MAGELKLYSIHGLLTVLTNLGRVEIPRALRAQGPPGRRADVRIFEGPLPRDLGSLRPLGLRILVGDGLIVHRCLSYGRLELLLRDLLGSRGPTDVIFTRQYRVFREKLKGYSIWHFLKLVIMVRLLATRGHTFAHASAVGREDEALIFTGWSDVGKTTTAVGLVKARPGELGYISGDIVISGPGGSVLAWPSAPRAVVRPFEKVPLLRTFKLGGRRILPEDARLVLRSKASHLFILERGPSEAVRRLGFDEALRKLVLSTDMAFNFTGDQLLLAYSYVEPALDLGALRERHLGLLADLASRSECLELVAPEPRRFIGLALEAIS